MTPAPDQWGVVANYDGDKVVAEGARCWMAANYCDTESQNVWARSRGGRWIEKYVAIQKLHNFRVKWLVQAGQKWASQDKKEAETYAWRLDQAAQAERARRNMREVERMAGLMDENGRRSTK